MVVNLAIDCGATNIRVNAVSPKGSVVASHSVKNNTRTGAEDPRYHIWDIEEIWQKICQCSRAVMSQNLEMEVTSITVTTFGVDGAPFDADGNQLYPIISWKCPRAQNIMVSHSDMNDTLKQISGVSPFYFNTVYKLIWLKQNQPRIWDACDQFVFISSMINQRLSGEFSTDSTMLGTSMLTDYRSRSLSETSLKLTGLDSFTIPRIVEAGQLVGHLTKTAAQSLGLKDGIPVVSAGHDTQFALMGSGAGIGQAVLSSGTWDILMARVKSVSDNTSNEDQAFTTELDAVGGVLNPGLQWIASGFLEWLTAMIYADLKDDPKRYNKMIDEAKVARSRGESVEFENDFLLGHGDLGVLKGLHLGVSRGAIYGAALLHLAKRLDRSLVSLENFCSLEFSHLTCVGGGTKNLLLNQLRADLTSRSIHIVDESECTAVGSSMFGFTYKNIYPDLQDAQNEMKPSVMVIQPS